MSRDKRLQDRSIYLHWCSDTVRFSDQDSAGHVNNVALCAYLETARLTFMRDMGMFAPKEDGVRGISAGMTVSFLAESHWPGQVELARSGYIPLSPDFQARVSRAVDEITSVDAPKSE